MTIQRKNIITQKVSLQLKGQKYPVLPSNIYSWYKIFRKQISTKNSNRLLVPTMLVICVHFIIMLHNLYLFLFKHQVFYNKNIFFQRNTRSPLDIIPK